MNSTMYRCWQILDRDGDPVGEDQGYPVAHYSDAEQVRTALREMSEERTDLGLLTEWRPAQLPSACLTLTCRACGTPLGDTDEEIAIVHLPDEATLTAHATDSRWSTDGHRWNCEDCPRLHPDLAHLPGPGQTVLNLESAVAA